MEVVKIFGGDWVSEAGMVGAFWVSDGRKLV